MLRNRKWHNGVWEPMGEMCIAPAGIRWHWQRT